MAGGDSLYEPALSLFIAELEHQLSRYGIDHSNDPRWYRAVEETKLALGVVDS